jgi:acyl-CoA synthetase (AMP-forming)/AMP-acid ligase II
LIGGIVFPLYVGIPCAFLDPAAFLYKPAWWLQAISTFRGTMSCAPNFGYEVCVERVLERDCDGLDLGAWSVAQIGAEPIQKRTMDRFSERFAPYGFRPEAFHPTYGLAEHTLIVSGVKRRRRPTHLNARRAALEHGVLEECVEDPAHPGPVEGRVLIGCGLPVAPDDLRIVNPETRTSCRQGEVGEVWLSGASVAGGYWQDPVATVETFAATRADGGNSPHLRTGDLGFLWQGELFLCGRLKDMIIKGGNNHFAEDIERSVESGHPALRSGCGAAFGVDAAGQERLVIVYELNYGQKPDLPTVIGSIQRAIGREHNTLADAIVLIQPGTLEKTSSGKVRRREVRRQFLERELQELGGWRSW